MPIEGLELECAVVVPVMPDAAFDHFVERFSTWWPSEYTWSGERLGSIDIDPRAGGRCTETSGDGFTLDFGRVLVVERPHRLILAWCIDPARVPVPDVERASTVSVSFSPCEAGSAEVTLHHSGFERHGDAGEGYRDAMASGRGWPFVLERYSVSVAPAR